MCSDSASSCCGYSVARSSRVRKQRSLLGSKRVPASATVQPRRIALITSCSARRRRRCMCTSPLATRGMWLCADSACMLARCSASRPSRCSSTAIHKRLLKMARSTVEATVLCGSGVPPRTGSAAVDTIAAGGRSHRCIAAGSHRHSTPLPRFFRSSRQALYSPFAERRRAWVINWHRSVYPSWLAASSTRRTPSCKLISVPMISLNAHSRAACQARTMPAIEHSSVIASA